jgi:hypothetical protein
MRYGWIAGAAVAVLGVAGGAGSLAPESGPSAAGAVTTYRISSSGTGLQLTIDGRTLQAATSGVSAGAGAPVDATASGELAPTQAEAQRASATAPGSSQSEAQTCVQRPTARFPSPFSTSVALGAACSGVSASESASGLPAAKADASVATVGVAPPSGGSTPASALRALLPTPVTPGSALASSLTGILGTLPVLPSSGLPLSTVVERVAAQTNGAPVTSLVTGNVGPSTSGVTSSGGAVTSTSTETGATIELLVGAGAGGGALLTVDVGHAATAAHIDLATGTVTEEATAAAVTVKVSPPAGTPQSFSIPPGASQSFFTGTPLATTVSVASARKTTHEGIARATGVAIDLAQAAPAPAGGGIDLVLGAATTQAAGSASPPPPSPASAASSGTAPAVLTGATTVHTGEPWAGPLPIALLSLSLLAGLGLVARRHLLVMGHVVGRAAGRLVQIAGRASHSAGPGSRALLRSPSGPGPGPAVGTRPGDE